MRLYSPWLQLIRVFETARMWFLGFSLTLETHRDGIIHLTYIWVLKTVIKTFNYKVTYSLIIMQQYRSVHQFTPRRMERLLWPTLSTHFSFLDRTPRGSQVSVEGTTKQHLFKTIFLDRVNWFPQLYRCIIIVFLIIRNVFHSDRNTFAFDFIKHHI